VDVCCGRRDEGIASLWGLIDSVSENTSESPDALGLGLISALLALEQLQAGFPEAAAEELRSARLLGIYDDNCNGMDTLLMAWHSPLSSATLEKASITVRSSNPLLRRRLYQLATPDGN